MGEKEPVNKKKLATTENRRFVEKLAFSSAGVERRVALLNPEKKPKKQTDSK